MVKIVLGSVHGRNVARKSELDKVLDITQVQVIRKRNRFSQAHEDIPYSW